MLVGECMIAGGLLGIGMGTFIPGILATVAPKKRFYRKEWNRKAPLQFENQMDIQTELKSIDILVPAHHERTSLPATLAAIEQSWIESSRQVKVRILIGLDHSDEDTKAAAHAFAKGSQIAVKVIENPGAGGKWSVLRGLLLNSSADWVGFVDSGTIWGPGVLGAMIQVSSDMKVIAVAPSYRPKTESYLNRLLWKLEMLLKSLENKSGGPISVHGATVFYKRSILTAVFEKLSNRAWLNDDVVLPFLVRSNFPSSKVLYLGNEFKNAYLNDIGVTHDLEIEARRRVRILAGNIEWVSYLLLPNLHRIPFVVLVLASRRIARLFWSYSILSILIGFLLLMLDQSIALALIATSLSLGAMIILGKIFTPISKLRIAFVSALQIPFHIYRTLKLGDLPWA